MAEPGKKWWRRLLLVIAVGPGAGTLAFLFWLRFSREDPFPATPRTWLANLAAIGALWGVTSGILRKSLQRILIGLHWGAAVGGTYAYLLWYVYHQGFVNEWYMDHGEMVEIAITLAAAGFLGCGLSIDSNRWWASGILGAISGIASFTIFVLGILAQMQLGYRGELRSALDTFLRLLLPLSCALYLFFWLIADVLPRREAAKEKKNTSAEY